MVKSHGPSSSDEVDKVFTRWPNRSMINSEPGGTAVVFMPTVCVGTLPTSTNPLRRTPRAVVNPEARCLGKTMTAGASKPPPGKPSETNAAPQGFKKGPALRGVGNARPIREGVLAV
jgi:hypothetical protein